MIDAPVRTAPSDEPITSPIRRRPLRSRVAAGHVVMVLAALLAFVLVLVAVRDRDRTSFVAVAVEAIEQGTTVDAGSVEFLPVNIEDAELFAALVDGNEMQTLLDAFAVATRSLAPGSVLLETDLRVATDDASGLRAMSVELPSGRAVAGRLRVGDRVDVIDVADNAAVVVASDIDVIGVSDSSSDGFGSGGVTLTLAVDAAEALRLAHAMAIGDVFVVRATGAPQIDVGETYRSDDA
jgi:hypothetical protein